jgi:hypothetical protein
LCATLIVYFLPDELLSQISVGDVKPMFATLAVFVVAVSGDFVRLSKRFPYLCLLGLLFLQCSAFGFANGQAIRFSIKYFTADALFFLSFVGGLVYGTAVAAATMRRVARIVIGAGGIIFAADLLLLYLGVIAVPSGQPGFFNWSMFRIVIIGIIFCPLTLFDETAAGGGHKWLWPWSVMIACTITLLAVSDKRSLVLYVLTIMCMLLTAVRRLNAFQSRIARWALLVAVLTAGAGIAVWEYSGIEIILPRFESMDVSQEQRIEELRMMFNEVGNRVVVGTGFGGLFRSPVPNRALVGTESDYLALTPHIGIVTPLLKCGICGFMLLIGVPIALLIRRCITRGRKSTGIWSGCGMVTFFVIVASTSGGWEPGILIGLGLGTALLGFRKYRRTYACATFPVFSAGAARVISGRPVRLTQP